MVADRLMRVTFVLYRLSIRESLYALLIVLAPTELPVSDAGWQGWRRQYCNPRATPHIGKNLSCKDAWCTRENGRGVSHHLRYLVLCLIVFVVDDKTGRTVAQVIARSIRTSLLPSFLIDLFRSFSRYWAASWWFDAQRLLIMSRAVNQAYSRDMLIASKVASKVSFSIQWLPISTFFLKFLFSTKGDR